ncbi:hypothetical protein ABPG75_013657 [Micractinium tetrahymenae]
MADAAGLVFSIARLGTPALELGLPDRLVLEQDLVQDALALRRAAEAGSGASGEGGAGAGGSAAAGFATRVQADAEHPVGGTGGGLLKLPQAFGSVYLGQSFSAIVTACNFGSVPLAMVGIKVELATERSRLALLYDSTGQPLPHLQPGQRHDFTVRHDIKDLGNHSLTCTATFTLPDGERRQQAQAFSFSAANPLVVRTKQRHVGEAVFLEAALENATRDPMLLDTVTFLPSPGYAAERIGGGGASSGPSSGAAAAAEAAWATAGPLSAYIHALPLMPPDGSTAFLFRLSRPQGASGPAGSPAGSGEPAAASLGKIEIRWRGPMGQMARLQTQMISLPPQQGPREASLSIAHLPARVVVGVPFTATLRVRSLLDRPLGPLKVAAAPQEGGPPSPASTPPRRRSSSAAEGAPGGSREGSVHTAGGGSPAAAQRRWGSSTGASGAPSSPTAALAAASTQAVCLDGAQEAVLGELAPRQEASVSLRLLALASGQQALPGLALLGERDGRRYASLAPAELFVDSAC